MSKFLINYLKLITILLCHQALTTNATETRIVGGDPTTIDKHKYLVSLRANDGRFFCGGSLVGKLYVATAAHCVKTLTRKDFKVHGGVTYLNEVGEKRSVEKITRIKAYNDQNFTMDVAVLKLTEPMQGKNIATIPLCSHNLQAGDMVKVSGWGYTAENAKKPSNQLRTATVRMDSHATCKEKYSSKVKVSRSMMCASVPGKIDSCSGDSGGPLVHKRQLCGIVSFGEGCARKNYPGIYTNVNPVKQFIQKNMN